MHKVPSTEGGPQGGHAMQENMLQGLACMLQIFKLGKGDEIKG